MRDQPNEKITEMLRMMKLIRRFELRMQQNFKERGKAGEQVGAYHSYEGQEAVAVGLSSCLRKDDYVFSTHRGHGHALAKGADLKRVIAELLGKATGCSRGHGGSMHLFDVNIGLMGGNGIVGGGLPLALGTAYSAKCRGTDQVTVAYFGEGGASQGSFHESLNMAGIWKYPIIYACENNEYAATTHVSQQCPIKDIADRADGYGIVGQVVEGNDLGGVIDASSKAVARARAGEGPTLLEFKTYRHRPHCMVIPEHREKGERQTWNERDPIKRFEMQLLDEKVMTQAEVDSLYGAIEKDLDEALEFAASSPTPDPEKVAEVLWAS